jgi:hypothetical protein
LAQNLNEIGEQLALLKERSSSSSSSSESELRKHVKALERELEKCKADYKEHVLGWRERYALVMMDQIKRLEPLQTSAWKQGDLKKLLEEKPKKNGGGGGHKRAAPADGALAAASVKREKEDSLED